MQSVNVCHGARSSSGEGSASRGAPGGGLAGGRSIGMGISLPFETGLNPYVTADLAFEYMRAQVEAGADAVQVFELLRGEGGEV